MATVVYRQQYPNFSNVTVDLNGTKVNVIVTASGAMIDEWINITVYNGIDFHRKRRLVVGFSMDRQANTLNFCVDRRCIIFQLSHADYIPVSLRYFLWERGVRLSGFYNKWQREVLLFSKHRLAMNMPPRNLTWMKSGLNKLSTEEIISLYLGFKVELKEEIRTSDWSQQYLTDDQVLFACVESYGGFFVGLELKMWLLGF